MQSLEVKKEPNAVDISEQHEKLTNGYTLLLYFLSFFSISVVETFLCLFSCSFQHEMFV